MQMGNKFIKNTDNATVVCRLSSDKNRSFAFPNKKFDKRNNIIISNGYTEISEEDIKLLQEQSKTFNYYISNGKLEIVDRMPYDSMSADQLISVLKAENAELKRMLKEAQKGDTDALAELEAKVVEQNRKIKEQEDALAEKDKTIKALDVQLADKKAKADKKDKE